jgi:cell division protein FtsB
MGEIISALRVRGTDIVCRSCVESALIGTTTLRHTCEKRKSEIDTLHGTRADLAARLASLEAERDELQEQIKTLTRGDTTGAPVAVLPQPRIGDE